jgi:poly(A) polymerase
MRQQISPHAPHEVIAMTEREFAISVVRRLREAGHRALWAGGCVRDELLGLEPDDYDVATSAHPQEVAKLFRRTIVVGASFGVVEVLGPRDCPHMHVQVATFRSDGAYIDGRHPQSVHFGSPEEDAQRRDFTINGLFFDPIDGQLIDYVGGRADLDARLLRSIGEPAARFREDKLRLMRGVRLAARFALEIEPRTLAAIRQMAGEITVVSAERIADELKKMLALPERARAISLFMDLGLAGSVLPELIPLRTALLGQDNSPESSLQARAMTLFMDLGLAGAVLPELIPLRTAQLGQGNSAESTLWDHILRSLGFLPRDASFALAFACLLHPIVQIEDRAPGSGRKAHGRLVGDICRRLKLSVAERERVEWLAENQSLLRAARNMPMNRLKRALANPGIRELLALHRAVALAAPVPIDHVEYCENLLATLSDSDLNPPVLVTGADIESLGIPPGPSYKELLEAIRDAQLDGIVSTRAEALALLANQIDKRDSKSR